MGQTFFGLTSEYKLQLHKNIFGLLYYGNGGFSFETLYEMPVYLRNFYIRQFEDVKKKEMDMMKSVERNNKPSKR